MIDEFSVRNGLINTNARLKNYPHASSDVSSSVVGMNDESRYLSMSNIKRKQRKPKVVATK